MTRELNDKKMCIFYTYDVKKYPTTVYLTAILATSTALLLLNR